MSVVKEAMLIPEMRPNPTQRKGTLESKPTLRWMRTYLAAGTIPTGLPHKDSGSIFAEMFGLDIDANVA